MEHLKNYSEFEINESVNLKKIGQGLKSILLAPIAIPFGSNLSVTNKLRAVDVALERYLNAKIDYHILDQVQYDVEQPTILNKVRSEYAEIHEMLKKYPTLEDMKISYCNVFKRVNWVNLKSHKDINFLCDEIMAKIPNEKEELRKLLLNRAYGNYNRGAFSIQSMRDINKIDLARIFMNWLYTHKLEDSVEYEKAKSREGEITFDVSWLKEIN